MLESRAERNKLRHVVIKAEQEKVISKGEVGFVVTLVERFRGDIEKKLKQLTQLQGEIAQLKANEVIIISIVENLIKAKERDIARQETAKKLREARGVEEARHAARKKELPKEQADKDETLKELKKKEEKSTKKDK